MAAAITGAAVLGLTLAALFIPWDLTKWGHILGMASIIVFFVALATILIGVFYRSTAWMLALSVVLSLLYAAWLMVSSAFLLPPPFDSSLFCPSIQLRRPVEAENTSWKPTNQPTD